MPHRIRLLLATKEVDEDAPADWREMMKSNSPEEYYEKLGITEKKIIDDWTQKRLLLLQGLVSKSIEDSMKDSSSSKRTSVPYLKVHVKAFCRSKYTPKNLEAQTMSAELKVWRVSEEQLHVLKEGTVVRMKNLDVKAGRDGLLQLSASPETPMEPLSREPTQYELIQSGYEERCSKSLIRLNLMSKNLITQGLCEVDVVACVVKIQRKGDNASIAYLTDESGFIMKLERHHSSQNNDPFHLGHVNASLPAVVSFCNIQVKPFDTLEQCAQGVWDISSCKAPPYMMRSRFGELESWCNSVSGLEHCRSVLDRIISDIPICAGPFNRFRVCIGYILGFDANYGFSNSTLKVFIDYGEEHLLMACFPFHLLPRACNVYESLISQRSILDNGSNDRVILLLNEYFEHNQTLFRFLLESKQCYGDEVPMPEVVKISNATLDALSRIHLASD